jgi:hypothetical protein
MKRSRHPVLGILIMALVLAGCTLNNTPTPTPPLADTPTPISLATPAEQATPAPPDSTATSAATAIITGTPAITPGLILQPGTLQSESIIVSADGALQPTTISATIGLTLALTLVNRDESDALLVFELPSGAMAILVPGALATPGEPPSLNPTATALDQTPETSTATPSATAQPTERLLLPPTSGPISATIVATAPAATATPTPLIQSPIISAPQEQFYLRYDQPGSYTVRCAADAAGAGGAQAICTGSVTIIVTAPATAPTTTAPQNR